MRDAALRVPCPVCDSPSLIPCYPNTSGLISYRRHMPHADRRAAARARVRAAEREERGKEKERG